MYDLVVPPQIFWFPTVCPLILSFMSFTSLHAIDIHAALRAHNPRGLTYINQLERQRVMEKVGIQTMLREMQRRERLRAIENRGWVLCRWFSFGLIVKTIGCCDLNITLMISVNRAIERNEDGQQSQSQWQAFLDLEEKQHHRDKSEETSSEESFDYRNGPCCSICPVPTDRMLMLIDCCFLYLVCLHLHDTLALQSCSCFCFFDDCFDNHLSFSHSTTQEWRECR